MSKKRPVFYFGAPPVESIKKRNDIDWQPVKYSRVWAMPNHQTFLIKPIAELLKRYVPPVRANYGWVDPFCGDNSPAFCCNDHNPERGKKQNAYHMEALEFAEYLKNDPDWCKHGFDGILFDPPYSFRQISEHYKVLGQKATQLQTSMAFYEKVKSAFCEQIRRGGYAISFGWNTNGFGKARGFKIVEILQVAHGGSKNDTIVTVEVKI